MSMKLKPLFSPTTSAYNEDGAKLALKMDEFFEGLLADHPNHNPREFMFIAIDSATKVGVRKSVEVSEAISKEERLNK